METESYIYPLSALTFFFSLVSASFQKPVRAHSQYCSASSGNQGPCRGSIGRPVSHLDDETLDALKLGFYRTYTISFNPAHRALNLNGSTSIMVNVT